MMFLFTILQLYNGVKAIHTQLEAVLWILNFVFFLNSLMLLGRDGELQLPVNHVITRVNNQYTNNNFVFMKPLFFTFITVFNKLYELLNTLLQTRLCVRRFYPTVG